MNTMKRFVVAVIFSSSFLAAIPLAHATIIDFNFNSLADGAGNAAVRNYMNNILSVLHPGGSVAVSGAGAEKDYNGDGHAVGPISRSAVISRTLGNTNGNIAHPSPLDTYLINSSSNRITMLFSFPIYSVSFDYEIFPDGTCSVAGSDCFLSSSNWPDFTFEADDTVQFRTRGINPSVTGPFSHSPASGLVNSERAPQFLGLSGGYSFPSGVSKLEFIDWPRRIGIDNLQIQDQNIVPEPSSLLLLASGLLGLARFRRKRS